MTQPTAAAMRAAKAVFGCDGGYGGCNKKDAETIDHATGLPELIAACEAAINPDVKMSDARYLIENALRIAREGRS